MKTVLEELLEWVQKEDILFTSGTEYLSFDSVYWKIQELIPKEKEQIENAYNQGETDGVKETNWDLGRSYSKGSEFEDSEDYFNKTYKS